MYKDFSKNILLIGHETRLTMLIELSSGIALPTGELAKLAEANLISVKSLMQSMLYLLYLHL